MQHLVQGDLGTSIATKRPVFQELTDRLPATLELLSVATLLSIIIGIPLGVISARLQGKALDAGVRTTSIIGVSLPAFWLGLLLQLLFSNFLGLLPVAGRVDSGLRFTAPDHPDHRLLSGGHGDHRQLGRVSGRAGAHHPPRDHAGSLSDWAGRAHDAGDDARSAGAELHPHRPRLRHRANG